MKEFICILINNLPVISSPSRYIFWADWGKPARIERSLMDGTGRKTIVDTNNGFPTGMAIDFV